jgi:hypothetical protein
MEKDVGNKKQRLRQRLRQRLHQLLRVQWARKGNRAAVGRKDEKESKKDGKKDDKKGKKTTVMVRPSPMTIPLCSRTFRTTLPLRILARQSPAESYGSKFCEYGDRRLQRQPRLVSVASADGDDGKQ